MKEELSLLMTQIKKGSEVNTMNNCMPPKQIIDEMYKFLERYKLPKVT